ncbi:MAG: hypothetical protein K6F37_06080 [Lachnospiraceae bacterium]|nr:hypothetical protein [Lachnospiraceae bacterium]
MYWAIFISSQSTLAKFYAIYEVGDSVPDTRDKAPKGLPDSKKVFTGFEDLILDYDLLKEIVEDSVTYEAFQFSILQILPKTLTDDEVVHIETRWKDKLMSKQFGMNDN